MEKGEGKREKGGRERERKCMCVIVPERAEISSLYLSNVEIHALMKTYPSPHNSWLRRIHLFALETG